VDKLLTYAIVLDSFIVTYIQLVIMLIELKIIYVYCTEIIYTVYCKYTVHIYSTHLCVH